MKKVISLVLVLITLIFACMVFAHAEDDTLVLTVNGKEYTLKVGETVFFSTAINANQKGYKEGTVGLEDITYKLYYDDTKMKFEKDTDSFDSNPVHYMCPALRDNLMTNTSLHNEIRLAEVGTGKDHVDKKDSIVFQGRFLVIGSGKATLTSFIEDLTLVSPCGAIIVNGKVQTGKRIDINNEFKEDVYLLGDSDKDSIVTVEDATKIQKYLALMVSIEDIDSLCADSDIDNELTVMDATAIQKYVAKIKVNYPIGKYISK